MNGESHELVTKSNMKKAKKSDPIATRTPSPPPRPIISQAVKDKLQEDDERIAFLEKKLKLKSKKLSESEFEHDGLNDLLSGLDDMEDILDGVAPGKKRKSEGDDDWLAKKRQKALRSNVHNVIHDELDDEHIGADDNDSSEQEDEEHNNDDDFGDSNDSDALHDILDDSSSDESNGAKDDASFDGFESDNDVQPEKRVRENPYVAPTTSAKYVPPSLRKQNNDDPEDLTRLRRQATGLINRLSEANLISILGDVENLYRTNARQHVTSILIDLLLSPICESTSARDTDIILRGGFIMAIYKIVGTDFGAQVVQRIVELFDRYHALASEAENNASTSSNKQSSNLIVLLCELYNFQMIRCNLIFDYVRLFLTDLTELNAELLLKITRMSGQQLRQDDPSSLKDIVVLLRPAIAKIGEENVSVRTKFMVDAINDLKNNKKKTGAAASAIVSEHTVRMKKTIGTLNTRNIKGSEPLSIGLKDIQQSDKKGKWWLVGASWAGNDQAQGYDEDQTTDEAKRKPVQIVDDDEIDLYTLARQNGMNTEIRRSIFITLMSSLDYVDAHTKLQRLKLKKVQEQEIPKVLLHCASSEANYNHYYTLIAKKVCATNRKLNKAFQFALWDTFGRLEGNVEDEEVDSRSKLALREIVSLAKLYGHLIASHHLSLLVLKNLNLTYLQEDTKIFLEVMFITLFLQCKTTGKRDEARVKMVMETARGLDTLVQGLIWLMKKVLMKTEIAGGGVERSDVKWATQVAIDVLEGMTAGAVL